MLFFVAPCRCREMEYSLYTVPMVFGIPLGVVAALSTISPTAAVVLHKIVCYAWYCALMQSLCFSKS